jgi:uncharacterized protein (TIGR02284 family)
MPNDDTIDTLNRPIEISKDGEYGFCASAEHLRNTQIQALFLARAEECRLAAADLGSAVVRLGGEAEDSGTAKGAMHRGWVSVKSALSSYTDLAILEEVERGEDAALAAYRKAIRSDLPTEVLWLVQRQYEGVKRNHDQVRTMRDQARAAKELA